MPPALTYFPGNNINTGNGCLYISPNPITFGITIDSCTFICAAAGTQRPPFIGVELHTSYILDKILLSNHVNLLM